MARTKKTSILTKIKVALSVLASITAIGGAVWFMVDKYYQSKIEILEIERNDCYTEYDSLKDKTKGCLEPRLDLMDTLTAKSSILYAHGGNVHFEIIPTYGYEFLPKPGGDLPVLLRIIYYNNEISSQNNTDSNWFNQKLDLDLRPGEMWEYTFKGNKFYFVFDILDREKSIFLGRIYELMPLYVHRDSL